MGILRSRAKKKDNRDELVLARAALAVVREVADNAEEGPTWKELGGLMKERGFKRFPFLVPEGTFRKYARKRGVYRQRLRWVDEDGCFQDKQTYFAPST
jgi:hypothetical protein